MIVEMKDITWERGDDTILQGVSWSIASGEHWCLLGLNGSGKTTLLNMINGYIWPTSGFVAVLGHKFGEYDLRELRKSIGWVSTSLQQKLYATDSALKTVLSGKNSTIGVYDEITAEDEHEAKRLLEQLGCQSFAHRNYGNLSQGEKQRILIARALMNKPKLLILDEPCTGLDIFAREQLLSMIDRIAKQDNAPTLIYVTHHVEEILPCFTKTFLIKSGKAYAEGYTESVLHSEMMSDFFDVDVNIEKRNGRNWLEVVG